MISHWLSRRSGSLFTQLPAALVENLFSKLTFVFGDSVPIPQECLEKVWSNYDFALAVQALWKPVYAASSCPGRKPIFQIEFRFRRLFAHTHRVSGRSFVKL